MQLCVSLLGVDKSIRLVAVGSPPAFSVVCLMRAVNFNGYVFVGKGHRGKGTPQGPSVLEPLGRLVSRFASRHVSGYGCLPFHLDFLFRFVLEGGGAACISPSLGLGSFPSRDSVSSRLLLCCRLLRSSVVSESLTCGWCCGGLTLPHSTFPLSCGTVRYVAQIQVHAFRIAVRILVLFTTRNRTQLYWPSCRCINSLCLFPSMSGNVDCVVVYYVRSILFISPHSHYLIITCLRRSFYYYLGPGVSVWRLWGALSLSCVGSRTDGQSLYNHKKSGAGHHMIWVLWSLLSPYAMVYGVSGSSPLFGFHWKLDICKP